MQPVAIDRVVSMANSMNHLSLCSILLICNPISGVSKGFAFAL